ncbi:MAG: hypothetical protein BWX47_01407 [candidate division Hyd24-12 bacterium ADurb.Bin004]|nr:MAG: hypothetical protein BWX47_01407 [candidate division Hyd24-12 bacterium ADurb.Bin004]
MMSDPQGSTNMISPPAAIHVSGQPSPAANRESPAAATAVPDPGMKATSVSGDRVSRTVSPPDTEARIRPPSHAHAHQYPSWEKEHDAGLPRESA